MAADTLATQVTRLSAATVLNIQILPNIIRQTSVPSVAQLTPTIQQLYMLASSMSTYGVHSTELFQLDLVDVRVGTELEVH